MKKAAALAYQTYQDNAPKVTASGQGAIAEHIINKAKEFDIPIFSNEALINSLITLKLDEEIPTELYSAVVEVFIWLQECQKKAQLSKD